MQSGSQLVMLWWSLASKLLMVLPWGQFLHAAVPLLGAYLPPEQTRQSVSESCSKRDAARSARYVPAEQFVQAEAPA